MLRRMDRGKFGNTDMPQFFNEQQTLSQEKTVKDEGSSIRRDNHLPNRARGKHIFGGSSQIGSRAAINHGRHRGCDASPGDMRVVTRPL